jgi:hypothetical protein
MNHGTYIGTEKGLNGKEAMLQVKEDTVLAQFDDIGTGMGFNWYEFPISDWEIDDNPFEMA